MPKLTKREKILIFVVGIVLMSYVTVQFGVTPLFDRLDTGREELALLTAERNAYEASLAREASLREGNESARRDYADLKATYPAFTANENIDFMLTNLCVRHGLRPISLRIQEPANVAAVTITRPVQETEETDEWGVAEYEEYEESNVEEFVFTKVGATMTLNGSYSSLGDMITTVESMDHIRITTFRYMTHAGGDRDTPNIAVTFEVTLFNDVLKDLL